ncbi:hypothetical protein F442_18416 [Phytophthora nicotianae P10297]|uniref:ZSWIM1/3 helical domain-containing protein n=1 Tax=Phytophthora nicotianae P10297 TaxID=1317064 RepID=W2YDW6_PHYNI|nr:hypothetical protein F442_18416 [Phytophthora nicotianae P10297]
MLEVGDKRSRIYDYLLEHDDNVVQADVDNLVRDYSSSMTNVDDNDETARELALFAAVDPEKLSSVADTACDETGVISIAGAHMRRVFARFSEYLKEMRSKPEFGKISSDDASQIDAAVHKMVYAASEHKYKKVHESLKGICERCGIDRFFKYFEKNWHSCTDRWVYYLRATLSHFNNHTNNRLESYFGKLKEGIDSSMSMANCIKALVAFDRRKQNDYEYRLTRIGRFSNSNYDVEMSTVLRFTTHYAAAR